MLRTAAGETMYEGTVDQYLGVLVGHVHDLHQIILSLASVRLHLYAVEASHDIVIYNDYVVVLLMNDLFSMVGTLSTNFPNKLML